MQRWYDGNMFRVFVAHFGNFLPFSTQLVSTHVSFWEVHIQHKEIVENEPFVLWLDNFCKLYRTHDQGGQRHIAETIWTRIALKRFAFPD